MSNDMKMIAVKGNQVIVTNGFESRGYSSDSIIAMTLLNPMINRPGAVYNALVKALHGAGVTSAYVNKQQTGGAVFFDKSDTDAATIKELFGIDINEWLTSGK